MTAAKVGFRTYTVRELICDLLQLDLDLPVMVNGYEGGLEDQIFVGRVSVNRDENAEFSGTVFGPHDEDYSAAVEHDPAILIQRRR